MSKEKSAKNCAVMCPDCPLRGEAKGPIIALAKVRGVSAKVSRNWGFELGDLGALVDEKGNVSQVVSLSKAGDSIATAAVIGRVDDCERPIQPNAILRFFGAKPKCGAIGEMAITSGDTFLPAAAEMCEPTLALLGKTAADQFRLNGQHQQ